MSIRSAVGAGIVCLGVLAPAVASAQQVVVQPRERERRHDVSITFSPIHLILPVFELSAEFRILPRVSVAAIAGGGSIRVLSESFGIYELGAQGRFYFLGDFEHGLHVGLELLYVGASGSSGSSAIIADGFSVGPLLGYKIAARFGLTFEVQGGVAYLAARASSSSGATSSNSQFGPIVNLNVGWSF